ncbi:hypothetical protein B0H13DRAFT_1994406 [Mycena leptocephala]|nr:hypothetical protein B0H13DRAFT_1994406 [Mycena leptocephala]
MHPSLQLSNFLKLPRPLRERATAAAHGSMHALSTLFDEISNIAPEHLPFLLPAFYSSLDPVEIPTMLERVDLSAMHVESVRLRVTQALTGLRGIATLGVLRVIPSPALVDLWPNAWQWIEFLDAYRDNLPSADILSSAATYLVYVTIFRLFRGNEQASSLIDVAGGVCVVVGRAWSGFVHADDNKGFDSVCDFLGRSFTILDHNKLDEFVVGAGNTRTDFASLVVSHIERVVPHSDTVVTQATLFQLIGVLYLVEGVFLGAFDVAVRDTLLSQGIVTALTTASRALSSSTEPNAKIALKGLFGALVSAFSTFPAHKWIIQALRAGLLPAVFSCSSSRNIAKTLPSLLYLLQGLLPASTVYHSVLSLLQDSLVEVRDRNPASVFENSEVLEHWGRFVELVEERLQVVKQYNTGSLLATRACNNVECNKICDKHEFKCCAGCTANYCSKACQKNDWRNGDHRHICMIRDSHLSTRDRSFMRALVLHDYLAAKENISMMIIHSMHADATEFTYTRFDYFSGRCKIGVGSLQEVVPQFPYDVGRVMKSNWSMHLHAIKVFEGDDSVVRVFPLRSASAELVHGLRLIAASIPRVTKVEQLEGYRRSVRDLSNLQVQESY